MKEEMKAMKDKITLMDTRIGAVITGNTTAINGIDALSALPASAHVPTSVASTSAALPITKSSDTNAVFLKSRDQAEIQANAIKPKWAVDVRFDRSPNRELVKQLLYYLEKKFAGTDMRTRDLRKCIYTNFCSRRRQQRELPETRRALNTNSRRSGRETDTVEKKVQVLAEIIAYLQNPCNFVKIISILLNLECYKPLLEAVDPQLIFFSCVKLSRLF
ncbi:hypothetical protein PHYBLDRAFT_175492 [Phycomyces blakesleeanus NRRL 1555(-)]|uniref:Uncharacterized protein n=1 Tax=Phycomyces blakesleeanus (strain ATCC 8743b / DSM 1359 / FGSC 10004 / NBRC 33097 / NRRL 1555) TaxID=763407 RepID=A0A167JKQ7_PHYB8|nr:hypothetical protein PHYBLDRAFT_175492 [Phycomyces blakesleeanus NRRL 1555(-)]OAD66198.1 hypothetical protein PHYBLDRAFT_175492 [Phycomyces blakesleeanus NRRL 1555(-)]|eukprot:XP_018284238.1 hypothetical protein PHYBLDRAFT_175492 [Phycomyces blakesleeanus NRRL 1555(-)]